MNAPPHIRSLYENDLTLLTLSLSLGAFAQEIELDAEQMSIDASEATVVRTNKTPDMVELSFSIPIDRSVCERYDTRPVPSTCYRSEIRRVMTGSICVRKDRRGRCVATRPTYGNRVVNVPYACTTMESYCAKEGVSTTYERDSMKIKFKDLPSLGDSESETFYIKAEQKSFDSGNVMYEVKPLETLREYKVSRKKFLFFNRDVYQVEEK